MPGSLTTLGRPGARDCAPGVLPSTVGNASASQMNVVFEAQWLAYALPCRRFTPAFAGDGARLGADVVRYSFIAVDLHHLLLAGLPAHTHPTRATRATRSALLCRQLPRRGRRAGKVGGKLFVARLRVVCRLLLHRAVAADAVRKRQQLDSGVDIGGR
jgi:hypothetical protein